MNDETKRQVKNERRVLNLKAGNVFSEEAERDGQGRIAIL